MFLRFVYFFLLLVIAQTAIANSPDSGDKSELHWQDWSADIFTLASREDRFVILDLEAVWCHWCHVMEETTYANENVIKLLKDRYMTVRVDQDASPDLSNRYGDYGWPATIVFAPDGSEIVKLRGYIPPQRMISLLQAIIDDPSPGPSVGATLSVTPSETAFLNKQQREHLLDNYLSVYDSEHGGWGSIHKFIHIESMDYALVKAQRGDKHAEKMARQTLNAALSIFDPVWGGVYQYSDKIDWSSPHYEKIMWYQAQNLRVYSNAYALWNEPDYLNAAQSIYVYLINFMQSPDGVFYTSQDADLNSDIDGHEFYAHDDQARRKLGMPRIDKSIYTRENGWVISALANYYAVSNDIGALKHAITAAHWVLENRRLLNADHSGFSHGESDRAGPYLGDSIAMGQALLDLYAATGMREWLLPVQKLSGFINANFKDPSGGGYFASKSSAATATSEKSVFSKPVKNIDENIQLARFANLAYRYLGDEIHKQIASNAMKYLSAESITQTPRFLAGLLAADLEMAEDPIHITIVGHRDNAAAQLLHRAARAYPGQYKRIDWWDKREGPLPNPDISYPQLTQSAAFACANQTCSMPVFKPDDIAGTVTTMMNASR